MAIHEPGASSPAGLRGGGHGQRFARALGAWDLTLLTIGGIMGSGLFLASGLAIQSAGPAIVLLFALALITMTVEIVALGEMSAADPVPGSFLVYARRVLGPGVTFVTGWIYWFSSVLTMSSEVTAAALLTRVWFSGIPLWAWALAYSSLIVGLNLFGVRSFGSIEGAMAAVKLIAILAFVALGAALVAGPWLHHPLPGAGLGALLGSAGPLVPHGLRGLGGAFLLVLFAYAGTGIVGMAAAEMRDPARNIPRSVATTVPLVGIMYLGSAVLLITMRPWSQAPTASSPFVAALGATGLPFVAGVMNVVLLLAVLSTMNAALYANVRVLYTLAAEGQAPRGLGRLNRQGVPARATAASAILLAATVVLAMVLPHRAYAYLITATGFQAMFVWLVVLGTHLRYRPYLLARGRTVAYRLRGYPYTTIFAMLVVLAALGGILLAGHDLPAAVVGLAGIILAGLAWVVLRHRLPAVPDPAGQGPSGVRGGSSAP